MASPIVHNRFALLVGINLYLNDSSRRREGGSSVSLTNLQGTANDVENIKTILCDRFQFGDFTILTSSPSSDPYVPNEPEDKWPTYANIKKSFDDIYQKTKSGDVFFFHFSGHGAPLHTTTSSPDDGRENDPSLMTADYCLGKPAVRGWELNEWLRRFNEKNVRVIVLLDSCYSGGAWRNGDRFRSPENWTPPPNLPTDEASAQGTQKKPGHRDGDLGMSWDINPKDFTLLAACQSAELAAERNDEGGAAHGAFTLALRKYFDHPSNAGNSTYRVVRDCVTGLIASWNLVQKPQVFGRDRLAFLEDYEPFLATPITATMKGGIVCLPVGEVHGINLGAEFITTSAGPKVIVSITDVGDHKSKATIKSGFFQDPLQSIELIPFRWSVKETFEVFIDPDLAKFRKALVLELGERIAGHIRYPEDLEFAKNHDPKDIWFRLGSNENGGIDIFGPEQLVGVRGPLRGWTFKAETDSEIARRLARAIAHLFRFGQILHLRNPFQDSKPFEVSLESDNRETNQKIRYLFQNNEEEELYFAVIILSSGFHVKQLFPVNDALQLVPAGGRQSFLFSLTVPEQLRCSEVQGQHCRYRDIIRTVVTRGKSLSLKSMELPDIWNVDQWDQKRLEGLSRNAEIVEGLSWWIQDDQKLIV